MRFAPCFLLAGLLALTCARAETVGVEIEGVEEDLLEAVRAGLSIQNYVERDVTPAQVRRLHARAEEEIRRALEPYGYYTPRIDSELKESETGFIASFRIDPGEPIVVRESSVRVEGPASAEPAIRQALEAFVPKPGERLDHGQYEESKKRIESALSSLGYHSAELLAHRVAVSRSARTADIDLAWQSGPRYRFGEVRFSEAPFPPEFLSRYVTWQEGDPYSTARLVETQQRLVDAGYFSAVLIQPDLDDAKDTEVPIDILLVPARRSIYSIALHTSTNAGPGVRVSYERRWVNDRGHRLRADVEYSQRLQSYGLRYNIPRPGPNDKYYNFGAAYRDEDTDTSRSRTIRLAANDSRQWYGFTRTIGLQFLGGDFEVGSQHGNSSLLFAEGSLDRTRADDRFFPLDGYSLNLTLRAAPFTFGSDTSFAQAVLEGRWIRSFTERHRILLRTSLGAMMVDDFNQLPPELRFFAGGDRSVRGFDYQQLGTLNELGEVIGGEFLAVGSAEYEYYFLPSWGVATFVDAGDAFRAGEFDVNVGVGVGVRWKSPVGLVRVDVARGVKSEIVQGFRLHIRIGPDL
ncbi:MAG: autotransporter assembly complex family protein [Pseudomonadota bacterium]